MLRCKKFKALLFFTALVIFSFPISTWAGSSQSCRFVFLPPKEKLETTFVKLSRKGFLVENRRRSLIITHSNSKGFLAHAELRLGVLSFGLSFKKESGKSRVKGLSGSEFFAMAMVYFSGDIEYIRGYWSYGVNLQRINRLTSMDESLEVEDVAFETWTGKQVKKYGFKNLWIVREEGTSGNYKNIIIDFYR